MSRVTGIYRQLEHCPHYCCARYGCNCEEEGPHRCPHLGNTYLSSASCKLCKETKCYHCLKVNSDNEHHHAEHKNLCTNCAACTACVECGTSGTCINCGHCEYCRCVFDCGDHRIRFASSSIKVPLEDYHLLDDDAIISRILYFECKRDDKDGRNEKRNMYGTWNHKDLVYHLLYLEEADEYI